MPLKLLFVYKMQPWLRRPFCSEDCSCLQLLQLGQGFKSCDCFSEIKGMWELYYHDYENKRIFVCLIFGLVVLRVLL